MAEHESSSYWAVLPAPVRYDAGLPPSARLLYAEISSLTHETGYCFAGNEYFQKLYSLSERTIIRLLHALENGGYIRIEDNSGGKGVVRKIYAGVNPLRASPDKNDRKPRQKCQGNPDKNVTHNKKEDQERERPPISPQGGGPASQSHGESGGKSDVSLPQWKPERFAAFYSFYPKHVGRQAACKAWDKLKPTSALLRDMATTLQLQKKTVKWHEEHGRYVPDPATWLNGRRWEDEVSGPFVDENSAGPGVSGSNTGGDEEVGEWL